MKRSIVGAAICAAALVSFSGSAFAGEITGNGTTTPIKEHRAASECSFSGLEDGWTIVGWGPEGPIIGPTEHSGPGWVQTPHFENATTVVHEPGVAGQACRGGGPKDG